MTRNITFLIQPLAFLLLCNSAPAAPLTKDDVVGTYQVGATTVDAPLVPTNFYAVTITFNTDGSFVASNAPASFFFSYPEPDMPKYLTRGTWNISYEGVAYNMDLTFTSASWTGSWGHPVEFYRGTPRIYITYLPFKDSSPMFHFYLTRQKR